VSGVFTASGHITIMATRVATAAGTSTAVTIRRVCRDADGTGPWE
jgi:hypothetical protein